MKGKPITGKQQELISFIENKMSKYRITEWSNLDIKDRLDAFNFIGEELEWANRMDAIEKGMSGLYYEEPSYGDH